MTDCQSCRRHEKALEKDRILACYLAEMYSPSMVLDCFCRPQMLWGAMHYQELGEGWWPKDGDESTSRKLTCQGNFVQAILFHSVISTRLKTTKWAGDTFLWEAQHGLYKPELLSKTALLVLNYISGREKAQTFPQWCRGKELKTSNLRFSKSPLDSNLLT